MAKQKCNHWVPQSYLRSFSINPIVEKSKRKIWQFRKSGGDPEIKSIDKVAVRFYLYAPSGPEGRDYAAERKLADLEQLFGLAYWDEVANGVVDLSSDSMRKGLALLTAVMLLRTPKKLRDVEFLHRAMVGQLDGYGEPPQAVWCLNERLVLDPSDWVEFKCGGEDYIKRVWLSIIDGARDYAEIFVRMRWSVHATEHPVFITCDSPVAVLNLNSDRPALRDPATSIHFPLSPTRVLHLDWRLEEPGDNYYSAVEVYPAINLNTWRNAIDAMFSSRHPDIVCAEMVSFFGE